MADSKLLERLEKATSTLEKIALKMSGGSTAGGAEEHPSAAAWDSYFAGSVQPFLDSAKKLKLDQLVKLCETGWNNAGALVKRAPKSKNPDPAALQKFLKPTMDAIAESQKRDFCDNRSANFHHHSAFQELLMSLGWVQISPMPQPHIQGQLEAADFHLSKVLMKNKDSAEKDLHREFVKQAKVMLTDLKAFVKDWFPTGLEYTGQENINDAPTTKGNAAPSVPPPIASVMPPAAAAAAPVAGAATAGGGGGMSAVLGDISKGTGVSKGLKKVTADMKTKNRTDRPGLVKAKAGGAKPQAKWAQKQAVVKAPSISLARGAHMIEYQAEGDCRVPAGATIKQSVFVSRCGECIVRVPEKVKGVMIDNCKKTKIVIDSVVSTVEVVNCQSVTIIITGKVNSVAVDKTNGCQIWLPKESVAGLELFTSSVSEVNVQVPGEGEDADPVEMPVPEQFKTVIQGTGKSSKLITGPVKHG